MDKASILIEVGKLVDAWCDRRCLISLRYILKGYPISGALTDGWAELLDSLKDVRSFAHEDHSEAEKEMIDKLVGELSRVVYRT